MKRIIKNILLKDILQVYGLGTTSTLKLLNSTGLNSRKAIQVLPSLIQLSLKSQLNSFTTGKSLRSLQKEYLDFQRNIKNYRGLRTRYGYPCRGQRTHTNANTKKKV